MWHGTDAVRKPRLHRKFHGKVFQAEETWDAARQTLGGRGDRRLKKQVRQQDAYIAIREGGGVKLYATPPPHFKNNISVTYCMPLSNLLKGWTA